MAGYNWQAGMSNNAVMAYNNGEKPLSKWNKKEIINTVINELINNHKDVLFINELINMLKKEKLKDLKELLLTESSYHHTSKYFNVTKFYSIDIDYFKQNEKYEKFFEVETLKYFLEACKNTYLKQINLKFAKKYFFNEQIFNENLKKKKEIKENFKKEVLRIKKEIKEAEQWKI